MIWALGFKNTSSTPMNTKSLIRLVLNLNMFCVPALYAFATNSAQYILLLVVKSKSISKVSPAFFQAFTVSKTGESNNGRLNRNNPIPLFSSGLAKSLNGSLRKSWSGLNSPPRAWYTKTVSFSMLAIPQWEKVVFLRFNNLNDSLVKSLPVLVIRSPVFISGSISKICLYAFSKSCCAFNESCFVSIVSGSVLFLFWQLYSKKRRQHNSHLLK